MQPIHLRIHFVDGSEKDVVAVAADLVAFEQHFDVSIAKLSTDVRLTYLFFICHHVLTRTGDTKDTFEKWMETVTGVTLEDSDSKK